jgi:hypothetical protein
MGEKGTSRDSVLGRPKSYTRKLRLSAVPVLVAAAAITLAATAGAGGQLFRELIDEEESVSERAFARSRA